MKDIIFLIISLLSVSFAFSSVSVSYFARRRGGAAWLDYLIIWLVSAALFLVVKNVGVFMSQIAGYENFESGFFYSIIFIAVSAVFVVNLFNLVLKLIFPRLGKKSVIISGSIGGLFLLILISILFLKYLNIGMSVRLLLRTITLYLIFFSILSIVLLILFRINKISEKEKRSLLIAGCIAGFIHVVLALLKWIYFIHRFDNPDVFNVVNISMLFFFVAATVIIGRKNLLPRWVPESVTVRKSIAGLTELEINIIFQIGKGASNSETASELGISLATVKNSLFKLYKRFDVNSRTELLLALGIDGKKKKTASLRE